MTVSMVAGHPTGGVVSIDQLAQRLLRSGLSIETVVLAQQIYESSQDASGALQQIDHLRGWRDKEQQRIDELRDFKAFVQRHGGDDERIGHREVSRHIDEFLARHPELRARYRPGPGENRYVVLRELLLQDVTFALDTRTGSISRAANGFLGNEPTSITASEIDAAIQRHRSNVESIDSTRELTTMRLQEIVQRKQRLTTLASNIADAQHRAQEAVVKNVRG